MTPILIAAQITRVGADSVGGKPSLNTDMIEVPAYCPLYVQASTSAILTSG